MKKLVGTKVRLQFSIDKFNYLTNIHTIMVKYTFAECVAPAKYIVSKSVNVSLLCVAKTYTDVVHQISITSTHILVLIFTLQ